MVSVLLRKLVRELWQLRGQVLAVVLVAAVGAANLVMSRATLQSLERSRDRFYREYAFADVFAELKRAPRQLAQRLAGIPGVQQVDPRISVYGRAELAGFAEPIRVQALSAPGVGAAALNRLHLNTGRLPQAGERGVAVVSDGFAEAHALRPGAALTLVLDGQRQRVRIVGIGSSPEFVQQMAPQAIFPDPRHYAILWLPPAALAALTGFDGAFNSVTLALRADARTAAVIAAVDRMLASYGGTGAIGREHQRSHRFLSEEFRQLETLAWLFPTVFLGVAAFVLHVVLGRLVAGQRQQIGTLKAFGFGLGELARHFAGFALIIGLLGAALGIALGAWLGSRMAALYRVIYRLPLFDFELSGAVIWLAATVCLIAALAGALLPVLQATRLPPAAALRVAVPWGWARHPSAGRRRKSRFSQVHQLILRNLAQRPLRTLLTCCGLGFGTAVMLLGRFQHDAVDAMVARQFGQAERHDLTVALVAPSSPRVLTELAALPGVLAVEAQRAVPVDVRFGSASYRTSVQAQLPGAELKRVLDGRGQPVSPPLAGVLLTDHLAQLLGAHPGDLLELVVLEGRRPRRMLPLAGVVSEPFGVQAWLPQAALDRLLGEGRRVSSVLLTVDGSQMPALRAALERRPGVAAISQLGTDVQNFYDTMAATILIFTLITTAFGIVITAGVVYSSARVAFAERARDLASLRVLGFTLAEVRYLLLGELALLTAAALPVGYLLGEALISWLAMNFDSDLFRIPREVSAATYGLAGVISLTTALGTGALVARQLGRLDLLAVLKAHD